MGARAISAIPGYAYATLTMKSTSGNELLKYLFAGRSTQNCTRTAVSIFRLILTLVSAEKHLLVVYHIASRLSPILGITYLLHYFELYNAPKAFLTDVALTYNCIWSLSSILFVAKADRAVRMELFYCSISLSSFLSST